MLLLQASLYINEGDTSNTCQLLDQLLRVPQDATFGAFESISHPVGPRASIGISEAGHTHEAAIKVIASATRLAALRQSNELLALSLIAIHHGRLPMDDATSALAQQLAGSDDTAGVLCCRLLIDSSPEKIALELEANRPGVFENVVRSLTGQESAIPASVCEALLRYLDRSAESSWKFVAVTMAQLPSQSRQLMIHGLHFLRRESAIRPQRRSPVMPFVRDLGGFHLQEFETLLSDPDPVVRAGAAWIAGTMGTAATRFASVLEKLQTDSDSTVVRASTQALQRIRAQTVK